uniref:Uncharacterized protein n=1 Tax=Glossina austeni TaxID=7395 RepID=A0A1A9VYX3_GLOAU
MFMNVCTLLCVYSRSDKPKSHPNLHKIWIECMFNISLSNIPLFPPFCRLIAQFGRRTLFHFRSSTSQKTCQKSLEEEDNLPIYLIFQYVSFVIETFIAFIRLLRGRRELFCQMYLFREQRYNLFSGFRPQESWQSFRTISSFPNV